MLINILAKMLYCLFYCDSGTRGCLILGVKMCWPVRLTIVSTEHRENEGNEAVKRYSVCVYLGLG